MQATPDAYMRCCGCRVEAAVSAGGATCLPRFLPTFVFPLEPWVRARCFCFQEYAQGGNLFSYVQAAGRLTEPMARWVLSRGRRQGGAPLAHAQLHAVLNKPLAMSPFLNVQPTSVVSVPAHHC